MEWKPIEGAPRDGSDFLGLSKDGQVEIMWWDENVYRGPCFFSGRYDDHWGDRPRYPNPTHWMPLPKVPE